MNVDTVATEPVAGYGHDQLVNAAHIMNAAQAMGLSIQGQTIGVMTAMGESSLLILDEGDAAGPDSRGLFQQRDNGAWGSYADRMDPTISATNFFKALTAVDGWETMEPTIAAHKAQANADPYHYETYWPAAQQVIAALGGTAGSTSCLSGDIAYPLEQPYNMTDDYGPRADLGVGASTQHPAIDLQNWPGPASRPVYAVQPGTVVLSDSLYLSIQHADGYVISYLHMKQSDHLVKTGDQVAAGQQIGSVGNEGPSTGFHLDIRIKVTGSTNPAVAALPVDPGVAAAGWAGYVNPEDYFKLWGMDICPTDWCKRQY
ncbi:M23 family metallopeptidase [Streptomyces sp. ISL-90]|nr:M23 family metallopeptidase [Streptomyces sp. ISL-90]